MIFFTHKKINFFDKRRTPIIIRKFKYENPQAFLYLASTFVGLLGGLAAVFLKNLVHWTEELVYSDYAEHYNIWTLFLPAIGILLTVLYIRFFVKRNINHGVGKVLAAISKQRSEIDKSNTFTSVVSSSLTVGFGGSVGLEAPIVYTGAAIGSNFAQYFSLNFKLRTLLIACGSSAAIAGIFKAPIAAIIFSLEVLMIDLSMWSIIPLLIASVTGALVSFFMMGENVTFSFAVFQNFDKTKFPMYILLGILCGLYAFIFIRITRFIEAKFDTFKNIYLKSILGGLLVGLLIFIFPPLFGEGYISLQNILGSGFPKEIMDNSVFYTKANSEIFFILFLIGVLFLKIISSSLTTASGGIGGVFAPSLFAGGFLGFTFSRIINETKIVNISEHNFALVGMAGVMSAIMHAPMTSIFLIAEITGGYNLLLPLIITSLTAYLVKYKFDKHSIYTYNLSLEHQLITHNKDKAALRLLNISKLVEKDFKPVNVNLTVTDLVKLIPQTDKNIFIVEDDDHKFIGIIQLEENINLLLNKEKHEKLTLADIVTIPPSFIEPKDRPTKVILKFDQTNAWYLPVIEKGIFIGMLSKSKILNKYRESIVESSDD